MRNSLSAARLSAAKVSSLVGAVIALLGLSFAMSLGSTAAADPGYPPNDTCTVSTSVNTVQPGQSLTLTGSGFPGGKSVALSLSSGGSLGTATANSDGSFTTTVDIPFTAKPDSLIVADSGSVTCSLDVIGPNGKHVHHTTPPPGQPTAFTGFAAVTATVIALALLGGGLLFVVVGRRRKNATD